MFHQDLSRQSESSDPRVAVFRRTVCTLTIVDQVDQSMEFQKNTYFVLNRLVLPRMQLQIYY